MISLLLLMAGAALAGIAFATFFMGGVAWLLAQLMKRFCPGWSRTKVAGIAASVVPILLSVNLFVDMVIGWNEPDLSGPDVQGIAFAFVVIVVSAGIGWVAGRWAANQAFGPQL